MALTKTFLRAITNGRYVDDSIPTLISGLIGEKSRYLFLISHSFFMFREEFTLLPFLQLSPTNSDLNISRLLGAFMEHMDFQAKYIVNSVMVF